MFLQNNANNQASRGAYIIMSSSPSWILFGFSSFFFLIFSFSRCVGRGGARLEFDIFLGGLWAKRNIISCRGVKKDDDDNDNSNAISIKVRFGIFGIVVMTNLEKFLFVAVALLYCCCLLHHQSSIISFRHTFLS